MKYNNRNSGQVIVLTTLVLGGTILTATTIAGLLMVYQIHQTADFSNSSKAIFAADTGLDWGLYQFQKPSGSAPQPVLSNGSSFVLACYDAAGAQSDCRSTSTVSMRSIGTAGAVSRAFELSL